MSTASGVLAPSGCHGATESIDIVCRLLDERCREDASGRLFPGNSRFTNTPEQAMISRTRGSLSRTIVTASLVLAMSSIGVLASTASAQPSAAAARDTSKKKDLPLAAGRKVTFTTDKVSWLSLDVSPDGRTIVFDLLGDLYTLPIAGGKATRLTSGMAYDAQPRFSPDGKKVVFVSDRSGGDNLWTLSLDGKDTA